MASFLKVLNFFFDLVENVDDTIAHGDDLAYLFEARTLDGEPIDDLEEFTDEDSKVRDIFTQMIATFAKTGKITIGNENFASFSGDFNNYIQVVPKPKTASNFRFCQMALWAGLAQRLQSTTCQFLNVLNTQIKNVEGTFYDTVNATGSKVADVKHQVEDSVKNTQEKVSGVIKNPISIFGYGGGNEGDGDRREVAQSFFG